MLASRWLADAVLALHAALVVFVAGGLPAIVAGNWLGWRWVNRFWLRLAHLAAIVVVAAESWIGAVCPLTTLELWLRAQAHESIYGGSFVEHWLQRMIFYAAPPWVFMAGYSLFGLAVIVAWWRYPPDRPAARRPTRLA